MLELPISSSASHFSQQHQVFGRLYEFEFIWIEHEKFWILNIFDHAEQPMALGIKLIPNWPNFKCKEFILVLISKTSSTLLGQDNLDCDFMLVAHEAF